MQPPNEPPLLFSSTEFSGAEGKPISTVRPVSVAIEAHNVVNAKTYKLSTEAEPFIPSFMRSPGIPSNPLKMHDKGHNDNTSPIPIDSECVGSYPITPPLSSQEDSIFQPCTTAINRLQNKTKKWNYTKPHNRAHCANDRVRKDHFDLWASQLVNMTEDEVHMLMDCLPEDIQHLYYHHLSQIADIKQPGCTSSSKDQQPVASQVCASSSPAVSAAFATFNDIGEERLQYIEQLLCLESLNDYGGGGVVQEESLFVNPDEGLNSEEEEWLLEQMMSVDSTPAEFVLLEPDRDHNGKGQRTPPKNVNGKSGGGNKGKYGRRRGGR
ncbi:unnamed protein product [Phytomonas sp. EM1]|nr:unnamed protein product [Phytomonas sp. EM1]|eukprot:CCW62155.1 unnamed protein product [Phytomonas sp. isolate EM1]